MTTTYTTRTGRKLAIVQGGAGLPMPPEPAKKAMDVHTQLQTILGYLCCAKEINVLNTESALPAYVVQRAGFVDEDIERAMGYLRALIKANPPLPAPKP